MSNRIRNADHSGAEIHRRPVSVKSRRTKGRVKSISALSAATPKKRGHTLHDDHKVVASPRSTKGRLEPSKLLSSVPQKRSHNRSDNHLSVASPRSTNQRLKSIRKASSAQIGENYNGVEIHGQNVLAADTGHMANGDHRALAGVGTNIDGQCTSGLQALCAIGGDHQEMHEDLRGFVIPTIIELWKNRQAWHRAEKSLTLQGKAQCRRFTDGDKEKANKLFASIEKIAGGDGQRRVDDQKSNAIAPAILPFIAARAPLERHRKAIERQLEKLAVQLPVAPWTKTVKGFGLLSLAAIVGEAGDLSNYPTVSKLWKRMGLAVINGSRQRRVRDAIEALEHGFSPQRGAVMFNIGGGLIGGMGRGPRPAVGEDIELRDDLSPYQKLFIRLIRNEVERVTETWNGPDHKREPIENKRGIVCESYSKHAANRIRRRIEKQFLCDLLIAWRSTKGGLQPAQRLSSENSVKLMENGI